jgi:hypothetical protein
LRKTGRHRILLGILFLLAAFVTEAQKPILFATVDKNPVGQGDVFTLKITLENGNGDIIPPSLSDFDIVMGPARSSSYRIVNGKQTSSISLSYTMRARETGTFSIGSASALVDGNTLKTNPIELKVVEGKVNASGGSSSNRGAQGATSYASNNQNLKAVIELSKRNAYIGEQIVIQYVLLTRYQSLDLGESSFPSLTGFWSEELKDEQASWEPDLEIINGVPYRKAVLKSQVIFPQRAGKIQIDPLKLTCIVNRSFFNPGTEFKIQSNSPEITVKALPNGAPRSFNGAVGNFSFKAEVSKNKINANDALDLNISIQGSGNLTLIDEPEISFPSDFEAYDPEIKDRISVSKGGVNGSRSFEYLVIPRYPGTYELEEIEFSYFNPATGKYVSEKRGPFPVEVSGEGGSRAATGERRSKKSVAQTANDIRYIITDITRLDARNRPFYGSGLFWASLSAPFVFMLIFLGYRRRSESLNSNRLEARKRKANKMATKRLKASKAALQSGDNKLFYEEIFKALYGYLGDKLGIDVSELTKPEISRRLKERNVSEELAVELSKTLSTCEMARFAPVSEAEPKAFYESAVKLIEKLENQLK